MKTGGLTVDNQTTCIGYYNDHKSKNDICEHDINGLCQLFISRITKSPLYCPHKRVTKINNKGE